MKFSIDKEYFLSTLNFAQGISEQNNINSYYSFLILEVNENELRIRSADRQSTFESIIEISPESKLVIEEHGTVLLPLIKVNTIVQSLPHGLITFFLKENDVTIVPKENPSEISFCIRSRSTEDYPKEIHKDMPEILYEVNTKEFYKIVQKTSFAASSENKNSFLTGLLFETRDKFLIAVATDRNRISISKTSVDFSFSSAEEGDIIVPSKTMNIIKKLCNIYKKTMFLALDDKRIYFKIENISLSANLISGKYYDYKKIIPKEKRNLITVNKELLKTALYRVSIISDDKKSTAIIFNVSEDTLVISSEEKEHGTSSEKVPITLEGKSGKFAAKAQFIYDPLQVIETENVIIDYGNEKRDLIKIISTEEENTIHITAPFNV